MITNDSREFIQGRSDLHFRPSKPPSSSLEIKREEGS